MSAQSLATPELAFWHAKAAIARTFASRRPPVNANTRDTCDSIAPKLFLSSLHIEAQKATLQQHGITHVLQVGKELVPSHAGTFAYLHVDAYDLEEQDLVSHFNDCFRFIDQGRETGAVLVHCAAGVSRSASVVIGYLMARGGLSLDDARSAVRAARPQINPNQGFLLQLQLFQDAGCSADGWTKWDLDRFLQVRAAMCPRSDAASVRKDFRGACEVAPPELRSEESASLSSSPTQSPAKPPAPSSVAAAAAAAPLPQAPAGYSAAAAAGRGGGEAASRGGLEAADEAPRQSLNRYGSAGAPVPAFALPEAWGAPAPAGQQQQQQQQQPAPHVQLHKPRTLLSHGLPRLLGSAMPPRHTISGIPDAAAAATMRPEASQASPADAWAPSARRFVWPDAVQPPAPAAPRYAAAPGEAASPSGLPSTAQPATPPLARLAGGAGPSAAVTTLDAPATAAHPAAAVTGAATWSGAAAAASCQAPGSPEPQAPQAQAQLQAQPSRRTPRRSLSDSLPGMLARALAAASGSEGASGGTAPLPQGAQGGAASAGAAVAVPAASPDAFLVPRGATVDGTAQAVEQEGADVEGWRPPRLSSASSGTSAEAAAGSASASASTCSTNSTAHSTDSGGSGGGSERKSGGGGLHACSAAGGGGADGSSPTSGGNARAAAVSASGGVGVAALVDRQVAAQSRDAGAIIPWTLQPVLTPAGLDRTPSKAVDTPTAGAALGGHDTAATRSLGARREGCARGGVAQGHLVQEQQQQQQQPPPGTSHGAEQAGSGWAAAPRNAGGRASRLATATFADAAAAAGAVAASQPVAAAAGEGQALGAGAAAGDHKRAAKAAVVDTLGLPLDALPARLTVRPRCEGPQGDSASGGGGGSSNRGEGGSGTPIHQRVLRSLTSVFGAAAAEGAAAAVGMAVDAPGLAPPAPVAVPSVRASVHLPPAASQLSEWPGGSAALSPASPLLLRRRSDGGGSLGASPSAAPGGRAAVRRKHSRSGLSSPVRSGACDAGARGAAADAAPYGGGAAAAGWGAVGAAEMAAAAAAAAAYRQGLRPRRSSVAGADELQATPVLPRVTGSGDVELLGGEVDAADDEDEDGMFIGVDALPEAPLRWGDADGAEPAAGMGADGAQPRAEAPSAAAALGPRRSGAWHFSLDGTSLGPFATAAATGRLAAALAPAPKLAGAGGHEAATAVRSAHGGVAAEGGTRLQHAAASAPYAHAPLGIPEPTAAAAAAAWHMPHAPAGWPAPSHPPHARLPVAVVGEMAAVAAAAPGRKLRSSYNGAMSMLQSPAAASTSPDAAAAPQSHGRASMSGALLLPAQPPLPSPLTSPRLPLPQSPVSESLLDTTTQLQLSDPTASAPPLPPGTLALHSSSRATASLSPVPTEADAEPAAPAVLTSTPRESARHALHRQAMSAGPNSAAFEAAAQAAGAVMAGRATTRSSSTGSYAAQAPEAPPAGAHRAWEPMRAARQSQPQVRLAHAPASEGLPSPSSGHAGAAAAAEGPALQARQQQQQQHAEHPQRTHSLRLHLQLSGELPDQPAGAMGPAPSSTAAAGAPGTLSLAAVSAPLPSLRSPHGPPGVSRANSANLPSPRAPPAVGGDGGELPSPDSATPPSRTFSASPSPPATSPPGQDPQQPPLPHAPASLPAPSAQRQPHPQQEESTPQPRLPDPSLLRPIIGHRLLPMPSPSCITGSPFGTPRATRSSGGGAPPPPSASALAMALSPLAGGGGTSGSEPASAPAATVVRDAGGVESGGRGGGGASGGPQSDLRVEVPREQHAGTDAPGRLGVVAWVGAPRGLPAGSPAAAAFAGGRGTSSGSAAAAAGEAVRTPDSAASGGGGGGLRGLVSGGGTLSAVGRSSAASGATERALASPGWCPRSPCTVGGSTSSSDDGTARDVRR